MGGSQAVLDSSEARELGAIATLFREEKADAKRAVEEAYSRWEAASA